MHILASRFILLLVSLVDVVCEPSNAPPEMHLVLAPTKRAVSEPADPRHIAQLHQRSAGWSLPAENETSTTVPRRQLTQHAPQMCAPASRPAQDAVVDGQSRRV